jgi:hypothetical protein
MREEENHLAQMEVEELEALRQPHGAAGEELLLPFAFLPDFGARMTTDKA